MDELSSSPDRPSLPPLTCSSQTESELPATPPCSCRPAPLSAANCSRFSAHEPSPAPNAASPHVLHIHTQHILTVYTHKHPEALYCWYIQWYTKAQQTPRDNISRRTFTFQCGCELQFDSLPLCLPLDLLRVLHHCGLRTGLLRRGGSAYNNTHPHVNTHQRWNSYVWWSGGSSSPFFFPTFLLSVAEFEVCTVCGVSIGFCSSSSSSLCCVSANTWHTVVWKHTWRRQMCRHRWVYDHFTTHSLSKQNLE